MSAQFEVPALPSQSQSSDSSSSADEDEPVEAKRRGKNYQYSVWQRFESKELFEQWWNDEKKNWVYQSRATNVNEMVETWFCRFASKYSNRLGYNCLARLRLLYPHHNNAVVVKRCENEHHHEVEANKLGLTEDQKNRARQLLEHGFTAKRIHIQITEEMLEPLPELKTVQWFINRLQKTNSSPFTDVELREYCESHSVVPEVPDQPFVLAYGIASTESFYVVWSTPKLLERQLSSEQLQVDATSSVRVLTSREA
ncbi:hypothetical protein AAVH_14017 [Aphelenchoides avenae]|nr:hypothetical protein AAVH_14017 [Aphelenchus avenae]